MTRLSELFDTLQQELKSIFADVDKIKEERQILENEKVSFQNKVRQLESDRSQLNKDKEELQRQKVHFEKLTSQEQKELDVIKKAQDELKQKQQEINDEGKKLESEKREAEKVIFKAKGLEEELKDFAFQKQLLEKEKAIDKERKESLDIRENKIKQREQQLQRQAEI